MAPQPKGLPPHVKRVRAKGRTYYYFDTGKRKPGGAVIYTRLPDVADKARFGGSYASCLGHRNRNANIEPELTIAVLIDRYQRSREFAKLAAGSQKVYNLYLRRIDDMIGPAPVAQLARRDVIAMMDRMSATPGAANLVLSLVGVLFKWARDRELSDADPSKGIESFELKDHEPWPVELLRAGLNADVPRVRRLVSLLYFTGQRIGDVARMRWSDITAGAVVVTQDKTGKTLEVALHPDLVLALGPRPNQDAPLLAKEDGTPFSKATLSTALRTWSRGLGYTVVAHGLRKNAVNALIEAGASVGEVSAVTGQSLAIVEHYAKRRAGRDLAARAIGRLSSMTENQD